MPLISPTNMKSLTDSLGALWEQYVNTIGLAANTSAGSMRFFLNECLTNLLAIQDPDQEQDMLASVNASFKATTTDQIFSSTVLSAVNAISGHCTKQGSTVDPSINNLDTYLKFYNAGGSAFTNMVSWGFGQLWSYLHGNVPLTNTNVLTQQIGPLNGNANGMGTATYAAVYTAGTNVDTTKGAEVLPVAVVTTTFVGGAAAPVVTVTGTDHLGNTGQTWTGTYGSNNPAATISTQTVSSGAISAMARQTVTVGSTTNIVPGSVLTINKNLPDEETVIVEAVPSGTTFTAVFTKAHLASATVDGNVTLTLTNGSSRRLRSVSNVAITISSHSAGVVRVDGRQDRVAA